VSRDVYEYPDAAGYPDGRGFLDEGTALPGAPEPADLVLPSAEAGDELTVVDSAQAFRAVIDGRTVATLHYATGSRGDVTLRSTVVDPGLRGRGFATALIAHVLDDLGSAGVMVAVECTEVRRFIELHPQYAGMVVEHPGEEGEPA
jgi:predicted GNAT family acetyltransferase